MSIVKMCDLCKKLPDPAVLEKTIKITYSTQYEDRGIWQIISGNKITYDICGDCFKRMTDFIKENKS